MVLALMIPRVSKRSAALLWTQNGGICFISRLFNISASIAVPSGQPTITVWYITFSSILCHCKCPVVSTVQYFNSLTLPHCKFFITTRSIVSYNCHLQVGRGRRRGPLQQLALKAGIVVSGVAGLGRKVARR